MQRFRALLTTRVLVWHVDRYSLRNKTSKETDLAESQNREIWVSNCLIESTFNRHHCSDTLEMSVKFLEQYHNIKNTQSRSLGTSRNLIHYWMESMGRNLNFAYRLHKFVTGERPMKILFRSVFHRHTTFKIHVMYSVSIVLSGRVYWAFPVVVFFINIVLLS